MANMDRIVCSIWRAGRTSRTNMASPELALETRWKRRRGTSALSPWSHDPVYAARPVPNRAGQNLDPLVLTEVQMAGHEAARFETNLST